MAATRRIRAMRRLQRAEGEEDRKRGVSEICSSRKRRRTVGGHGTERAVTEKSLCEQNRKWGQGQAVVERMKECMKTQEEREDSWQVGPGSPTGKPGSANSSRRRHMRGILYSTVHLYELYEI